MTKKLKQTEDGIVAMEEIFIGDLCEVGPFIDPSDKGHSELLMDLRSLLSDATVHEFHDFKNSAYTLPKVALVDRLNALRLKAQSGGYNN